MPNTPYFAAKALWNHVIRTAEQKGAPDDMPVAEFADCFFRIYNATTDVRALWQLGGAANDYLRGHPQALSIPRELALTLLSSDDVEHRVIGLKLLIRTGSEPPETLADAICRALARNDRYEMYGGILELHNWLDQCLAERIGVSTECKFKLIASLQELQRKSGEPYELKHATSLLEQLSQCF